MSPYHQAALVPYTDNPLAAYRRTQTFLQKACSQASVYMLLTLRGACLVVMGVVPNEDINNELEHLLGQQTIVLPNELLMLITKSYEAKETVEGWRVTW